MSKTGNKSFSLRRFHVLNGDAVRLNEDDGRMFQIKEGRASGASSEHLDGMLQIALLQRPHGGGQ